MSESLVSRGRAVFLVEREDAPFLRDLVLKIWLEQRGPDVLVGVTLPDDVEPDGRLIYDNADVAQAWMRLLETATHKPVRFMEGINV